MNLESDINESIDYLFFFFLLNSLMLLQCYLLNFSLDIKFLFFTRFAFEVYFKTSLKFD